MTTTPLLTPTESSVSASHPDNHSAPVPPAPPTLSTPQIKIKTEKTEPSTDPGPFRALMGQLAVLRAGSARSATSSVSASTSPTAVAPAPDVPSDQPVLGSAVAPIDLDALDKLQQILTFSAGLMATSESDTSPTSPQPPTQSPLPQTSPPGAPLEGQDHGDVGAVLALQRLQAILSLRSQPQQQQQVEAQQAQNPPIAIPIPQPATAAAQLPPWPTVKTEHVEPNLSAPSPRPKMGLRGAGSLPHRFEYRSNRSRSREYDCRGGYEYRRGREYYGRSGRSRRSRSPRARSYLRSRSRSRSSRSRSVSVSLQIALPSIPPSSRQLALALTFVGPRERLRLSQRG
ncbi:hypothetical protein BJV74DRAFT_346539 [Russula compacta]|nr:hypothetical protein BJV74DRAFT_346539 [Russula compacta]